MWKLWVTLFCKFLNLTADKINICYIFEKSCVLLLDFYLLEPMLRLSWNRYYLAFQMYVEKEFCIIIFLEFKSSHLLLANSNEAITALLHFYHLFCKLKLAMGLPDII